jgi:photosystem II protein PsbQ
MVRQRSILALILVLLSAFLISCGGPGEAVAPPSYTTDQLEKIQAYVPDLQIVRDRSAELEKLIQQQEWIQVGNFIHGPATEARLTMTYIIPNLLPQDQLSARKVTRDLFNHLVKIDQAANTGNTKTALTNYQAAFADIDKFLQLLPENQE